MRAPQRVPGRTCLCQSSLALYRPGMAASGWTRRLDDRADVVFRRRFGMGLTSWEGVSLRKQVVAGVAFVLGLELLLVAALLVSGHPDQVAIILASGIGSLIAAVVGPFVRQQRTRR